MAKIINTIAQSSSPPSKTNVLWDNGESLFVFRNNKWENIGGVSDEILAKLATIEKKLEEVLIEE